MLTGKIGIRGVSAPCMAFYTVDTGIMKKEEKEWPDGHSKGKGSIKEKEGKWKEKKGPTNHLF